MTNNTLFLASKSPRRHQLLTNLGYQVNVIASNAHTLRAFQGDEVVLENELPEDYVIRTAKNKFFEGLDVKATGGFSGVHLPVVAADTVVSLDGEILGKPLDTAEAKVFLRKLSGRTHEVRTAVCVGFTQNDFECRVSRSLVTFRKLSEEEIDLYVRTGEPYDKAGGYGIQGLASIFISKIEGSFTGIMGLPVFETAELLAQYGFPVLH